MSKRITVLVFTDGRPGLLNRTMDSFVNRIHGGHLVEHTIIVDDSGDEAYHDWLRKKCEVDLHRDEPERGKLVIHPSRMGFAGTIHDTWANHIPEDTDFILHLEDDFELQPDPPTSLEKMAIILEQNPTIAQVALLRQPWNPTEREAGGIIQAYPGEYVQRWAAGDQIPWVENNRSFTTNPCLYPVRITKIPWPLCAESEGHHTSKLRELGYRFGYLGKLDDPPRVMHIGNERIGGGY